MLLGLEQNAFHFTNSCWTIEAVVWSLVWSSHHLETNTESLIDIQCQPPMLNLAECACLDTGLQQGRWMSQCCAVTGEVSWQPNPRHQHFGLDLRGDPRKFHHLRQPRNTFIFLSLRFFFKDVPLCVVHFFHCFSYDFPKVDRWRRLGAGVMLVGWPGPTDRWPRQ